MALSNSEVLPFDGVFHPLDHLSIPTGASSGLRFSEDGPGILVRLGLGYFFFGSVRGGHDSGRGAFPGPQGLNYDEEVR